MNNHQDDHLKELEGRWLADGYDLPTAQKKAQVTLRLEASLEPERRRQLEALRAARLDSKS